MEYGGKIQNPLTKSRYAFGKKVYVEGIKMSHEQFMDY